MTSYSEFLAFISRAVSLLTTSKTLYSCT